MLSSALSLEFTNITFWFPSLDFLSPFDIQTIVRNSARVAFTPRAMVTLIMDVPNNQFLKCDVSLVRKLGS